ncbi:MAG: phosphoribosylanthranilate isomerase [Phreatobacter sp.]|uniref:phosphoribosylanthranilate isomerase n=1 Tax=Phreatobacter sp. TaxID=1966341 RepID=UPI001A63ACCF|nr:phosphoribosylanthranilate isomerase [Phreatobacter sp.]MBL8568604.1 phosphoribosylanthranilate isomerase [Phreatobacter sp.]
MPLLVKICGITTMAAMDAALDAGADMVGVVFFPKSPRNVSLATGCTLAGRTCGRAGVVALTVDPDDDFLAAIAANLKPDLVQLHGHETPERVADIRERFKLRVMKAIGVAEAADLAAIPAYAAVSDMLLVDAKPPKTAEALPGGNGLTFDWRLVAGLDPGRPVMLSGGLHAGNVAEAIRLTRLSGVDVSSGVESRPGVKDPDKIRAFVAAARASVAEGDR